MTIISKNSQPRVLHCFRLPKGGVFRHVCDLVHGQTDRGIRTGIVCDTDSDDDFADKTLNDLAHLCTLGVKRIPISRTLTFSDLNAIRQVAAHCRDVRPDIIHGHGAKGGAYARLIACCLGIKSVYTPHGGSLHYVSNSAAGLVYLGLEKLLKRHTDGLIFESHYSAGTYEAKLGAFPCDRKVIHNGLSRDEFDCWSVADASYDFVFIGELRKLKGIDTLLQATADLSKSRKINLLIVGTGPDEGYFLRRINELGISDSVTLLPPIFPASDAFNLGRCIVIPSLAESFPYIVLEALAAGAPVISTNVGGIPEIFGPYDDDLLSPGDVAALTKAMVQMLDHYDSAISRSVVIKDYVRSQFNLENMQDEIIAYYAKILSQES